MILPQPPERRHGASSVRRTREDELTAERMHRFVTLLAARSAGRF